MAGLLAELTPKPTPVQACRAFNTWLVLVATVVVPLAVMYTQEQSAWQRFQQEHPPEIQQRETAQAAQAEAEAEAEGEEDFSGPGLGLGGRRRPALPLTGMWLFDSYLASCTIWSLVSFVFSK